MVEYANRGSDIELAVRERDLVLFALKPYVNSVREKTTGIQHTRGRVTSRNLAEIAL